MHRARFLAMRRLGAKARATYRTIGAISSLRRKGRIKRVARISEELSTLDRKVGLPRKG